MARLHRIDRSIACASWIAWSAPATYKGHTQTRQANLLGWSMRRNQVCGCSAYPCPLYQRGALHKVEQACVKLANAQVNTDSRHPASLWTRWACYPQLGRRPARQDAAQPASPATSNRLRRREAQRSSSAQGDHIVCPICHKPIKGGLPALRCHQSSSSECLTRQGYGPGIARSPCPQRGKPLASCNAWARTLPGLW